MKLTHRKGCSSISSNELFRRNQLNPQYRILPWKRAIVGVKIGRHDLTFLSTDIGWVQQDFFLTQSLTTRKVVLVTDKSVKRGEITSLEDAVDLKIGSIAGDSLDVELSGRGIPHEIVPNLKTGINMISKRRFDAVLTYEYSAIHQAGKLGLTDQLTIHPLQAQPIYIGLSKSRPDLKKLLPALNRTIDEMNQDGSIMKLTEAFPQ